MVRRFPTRPWPPKGPEHRNTLHYRHLSLTSASQPPSTPLRVCAHLDVVLGSLVHNDVGVGIFFPLFCKKQEKKHWLFFFGSENYNSFSQSPELPARAPRALPAGVSPEQALPFLELCLGDFTFSPWPAKSF